MAKKNGQSTFQVGDQVSVEYGVERLKGVVIEDLGGIGAAGRRFLRVSIPMDPADPLELQVPEEELAVPESPPPNAADLSKNRIREYLTSGGLFSMLRTNPGGKNVPRIWLCLDNLGNLTHTFVPERGLVGGETPPPRAWHGEQVFFPMKDAVISFVQSFGLSPREASEVVSAVGTFPR